MIVGVAVCPGAPLLVPGLAPRLAVVAHDLVDSCASAVATLRDAGKILLLTSGPGVRDLGTVTTRRLLRHPPGTAVSSSLLTDSRLTPGFSSRLTGGAEPITSSSPPGVGVVVGAALLEMAGIQAPTTAVELCASGQGASGQGDTDRDDTDRDDTDHEDFAYLRALVDSPADRVGILLVGEGTASRGPDSPGGGHDGAAAFDATLAAALASGDPAALAIAVLAGRPRASDMVWSSGPSLGALAGLCADRPPNVAVLRYDAAPFGVGYLVATWSWV